MDVRLALRRDNGGKQDKSPVPGFLDISSLTRARTKSEAFMLGRRQHSEKQQLQKAAIGSKDGKKGWLIGKRKNYKKKKEGCTAR